MAHQFRKHYTREEASALLPQIRQWLKGLSQFHASLTKVEARLEALRGAGADLGGGAANEWIKTIAALEEVLGEFHRREIQIKDIERGLVDFPAIVGGKEVYLCWEQDEEDVEFWHDLDAGYKGRERL
jgi:hypothetical protein